MLKGCGKNPSLDQLELAGRTGVKVRQRNPFGKEAAEAVGGMKSAELYAHVRRTVYVEESVSGKRRGALGSILEQ
jgi:hypothetical protein